MGSITRRIGFLAGGTGFIAYECFECSGEEGEDREEGGGVGEGEGEELDSYTAAIVNVLLFQLISLFVQLVLYPAIRFFNLIESQTLFNSFA